MTKLFRIVTILIFAMACSKENEPKPVSSALSGDWLLVGVKYEERYNGSPYIATNFSGLGATLSLSESGIYECDNLNYTLYFAQRGNKQNKLGDYGGIFEHYFETSQLEFDPGVPKFLGQSQFIFEIDKLEELRLEFSTTDAQAIYDWRYTLGFRVGSIIAQTRVDTKNDGQENGTIIGKQQGFIDGYGDTESKYNPYEIAFAKGVTDGYNQSIFEDLPTYNVAYDSAFASQQQIWADSISQVNYKAFVPEFYLQYLFDRLDE